ncbi:MAG: glycosyltransferase [bacterium]
MANLLVEAGFYAGKQTELLPANAWNPKGHYESAPIVHCNDLILQHCGGSWDDPPPNESIERFSIEPESTAIIEEYTRHSRSVIKDPRFCLTLPVWEKIFAGKNVKVIFISRQEDAVAASLMRRDGSPAEQCRQLRREYNQRGASNAKKYALFHINYEDLFQKERPKILSKLSDFLEIELDLEPIASRIVDPSLCHHHGRGLKKAKECDSGNADNQAKSEPVVSIIVVSYNSGKSLERCLSSVVANTTIPYEIIVVDNASRGGIRHIIDKFCRPGLPISIIQNEENEGFARACNQGIRASVGEFVVLLNPDTVVYPGWLFRMKAHFGPKVGAVGPLSNYVAGLQKFQLHLPKDPPENIGMNELIDALIRHNRAKSVDTKLLIGFCMMLPRKVLEHAGFLDEDLFLGNDDLELSWRLRQFGYSLLIATDTFIHHDGQTSFKTENAEKTDVLLQQSADRLYEKLEAHYGDNNVPAPTELWSLDDWFVRPTRAALPERHGILSHSQPESMLFTGERAMPLAPNMDEAIMREHWARYKSVVKMAQGKRVLDVACGVGYGSHLLAGTAKCIVGGDITPEAINYGKSAYEYPNLHFGIMDIRHLPLSNDSFDLIVSFETLEHIEEGEQFLQEVTRILDHDGKLAISTPLGGDVGNPYHVAYYQRKTFEPFLRKFFDNVEVRFQRGDRFYSQTRSPDYAPTFTGEYGVAICRRPKKWAPKLTSIIILAFNGAEQTKRCLASIEAFTTQPHEVIIVDNGSTDETPELLRKYKTSHGNVRVITNPENLGFAPGNNQGISAASGEYVLLLNNDTVVTDGWLDGLLKAVNLHPEIGLAGPMTNYVFSSLQKVEEVNYSSEEELQTFAREFKEGNRGSHVVTTEKLVGFCLLIKRAVINKIGLLDENFGIGNFEDDDFCLRTRLAGFEFVVAGDVFIHHEGNYSFKENKIDYQDHMSKNLERFRQKWQNEIEFRGHEYFLKSDLSKWARNENDRGESAFNANNPKEAGKHFERALEWVPSLPEALNNLGVLCWELGDKTKAINYFMDAMESDPSYVDAIENLMQALPNIEKPPEKIRERITEIFRSRGMSPETVAGEEPIVTGA